MEEIVYDGVGSMAMSNDYFLSALFQRDTPRIVDEILASCIECLAHGSLVAKRPYEYSEVSHEQ